MMEESVEESVEERRRPEDEGMVTTGEEEEDGDALAGMDKVGAEGAAKEKGGDDETTVVEPLYYGPPARKRPLHSLPRHLVLQIAAWCDKQDWLSLALTSRYMRDNMAHDYLWRMQFFDREQRNMRWEPDEFSEGFRSQYVLGRQIERRFYKDCNLRSASGFNIRVMVRLKPREEDVRRQRRREQLDASRAANDAVGDDSKWHEDDDLTTVSAITTGDAGRGRSAATSAAAATAFLLDDEPEGRISAKDKQRVRVMDAMGGCTLYRFDHVFDGDAEQKDVYARVALEAVHSFVLGIDSSVMVYGQTGSGKTFTMLGPQQRNQHLDPFSTQRGLVLRLVENVLTTMNKEQEAGSVRQYTLDLSYVELYQSTITDLLHGGRKTKLEREPARNRHDCDQFYLGSNTECRITNMQDAVTALERAESYKHVYGTKMNDTSSRGHCVFVFRLNQHIGASLQNEKGVLSMIESRLTLVDLAGCERVKRSEAVGMRFDEAKFINSSLSALSRSIRAIVQRQRHGDHRFHVPYRDSVLTMLLRNALGGASKTTMLVCCSCEDDDASESISALRFGLESALVSNAVTRSETDLDEIDREIYKVRRNMQTLEAVLTAIAHEALVARRKKGLFNDPDDFRGPPTERNDLYLRYAEQLNRLLEIKAGRQVQVVAPQQPQQQATGLPAATTGLPPPPGAAVGSGGGRAVSVAAPASAPAPVSSIVASVWDTVTGAAGTPGRRSTPGARTDRPEWSTSTAVPRLFATVEEDDGDEDGDDEFSDRIALAPAAALDATPIQHVSRAAPAPLPLFPAPPPGSFPDDQMTIVPTPLLRGRSYDGDGDGDGGVDTDMRRSMPGRLPNRSS